MKKKEDKQNPGSWNAAQRLLDLAADELEAALFVKDRSGRYIYASRPFLLIAGLMPEETEGVADLEMLPNVFPAEALDRVLGGEAADVSVPGAGLRERLTFDFSLRPLFSPEGEVEGIAGIGTRADSSFGISGELLRSRDLEDARVILSRVAHDLNNYLYGVSGVASLALESVPEGKSVSSDLKEILEISAKIGGYLKKLQEMTGDGKADLSRESLNDILSGIVEYMRKELPDGIAIRAVLPDEECYIRAERKKIENAMLNICYNARNAIEDQGEIVIKLTGVVRMTGGREAEYYRIVIEDSGRGMRSEECEKCLQLFYTGGAEGGSLGMGLPVAESIIKRHHGELSLSTRPGKGTSVEILLPAG
ncbi:MAG: HAMP domain-containing sensor histidine kinase [Candidatus Krumholzibacteriales bacterium]